MEMDEVTGYHLDPRISSNSNILKENLKSHFPCPCVGQTNCLFSSAFWSFCGNWCLKKCTQANYFFYTYTSKYRKKDYGGRIT